MAVSSPLLLPSTSSNASSSSSTTSTNTAAPNAPNTTTNNNPSSNPGAPLFRTEPLFPPDSPLLGSPGMQGFGGGGGSGGPGGPGECKMVELHGVQVASFLVEGQELICLPQVFELFLKHLVGGLHTVYTKLKRLEIAPVVCTVEQVRVLRGLGAIQPGVNRCKLITRKDFETLYNDCTNARSAAPSWAPRGLSPNCPPPPLAAWHGSRGKEERGGS
ncbi:dachshund homolog 2-like, partial [Sceloporus undulatus]|uniref:dachshund homolog 2-like n=1 Tax=Sceloporus undulatus TaxID=8520 RepID=UPI001C4AECB0